MSDTIFVKVVANAKKNDVKEFGSGLKVYLAAPAVEGKANKALLEVLAEHFNIKKSQVSIVRGTKAKNKFVRIDR